MEWKMAGTATVDSGVRVFLEGISSGQQGYESGDTDDDDDCGMLFVSLNLLQSNVCFVIGQ